MSESFAELFEESLAQTEMRPGSIINGTVIEIRRDMVVVSAGLKSEGVIPIDQFTSLSGELEVATGDIVEVALDTVEDGYGETRLSREKAVRARVWKTLEKAYEDSEVVTGVITGKVKQEKSKAASPLNSVVCVPSCQVHWSMCARYAIRPTWKVRNLNLS